MYVKCTHSSRRKCTHPLISTCVGAHINGRIICECQRTEFGAFFHSFVDPFHGVNTPLVDGSFTA